MKRSFLNLKSTFMWMVLGTTLFLGACNGTSTESENAGVGAEATQTDSEEATGMVSETEPVQSMSQYFDATIAENKLTVVDFYTTWCGPCKRMDPFVRKLKQRMPI